MIEAPHTAPDLVLDGTGGPRRLRPQPGHRLLIAFYQEDGTPTCTTELSSFRADFDLLLECGAEVVAISTDGLASHRAFVERIGGLPFPLLSDPDGSASTAFGAWDPESRRSLRAAFVVDEDGVILHAAVPYSPANLTEYETIFAALGFTSG